MQIRLISQALGALLAILALIMAVPALLGWLWGEEGAMIALSEGVAATLGGSVALLGIGGLRPKRGTLRHREAFLVVSLAWGAAGVFGGLPFYFSGQFGGLVNAVFESVSGFTTTGATILSNVEAVPKSLLLWRATTHWLGGMGIVLLSVAVLPLLGVGGMELFKAEVPGPTTDKLAPRIIETARVLWWAYLLLTVAEIVLLVLAGMGVFDAVAHSFATVATGGFSTKNNSVEYFDSPLIEGIITVFMFLAGANFSLHILAPRKGLKAYFKDTEFLAYAGVVLGAFALVAGGLWWHDHYDGPSAARYGIFQVVSIVTTTGFSSADFEAWGGTHALAPFVLFVLMFIGGCSGSTGGGPKVVRIWLLVKEGLRELFRQIHPRAVTQLRLNDRLVPSEVLRSVAAFFFLYVILFSAASVALSLMGLDFTSALAASAACIGNIGPGLGTVGPMDNYDHIHAVGKVILTGLMILGRLELYTVLVLFVPEFWRR